MIYTVTFNPSLDYVIGLNDLKYGELNRTQYEMIYPGGKGINVSIMLNNLGIKSIALGFVAGFTGKEIEKLINEYGCTSNFISVSNNTNSRINVKLNLKENQTYINGQGPEIKDEDLYFLFNKLMKLEDEDILVLGGNIPKTVPKNIYEIIFKKLKGKKVKVIVDSAEPLLLDILKYEPFLVKPSKQELENLFNTKIITEEDILHYAMMLKDRGARNVIVSMGKQGVLFLSEEGKLYKKEIPKGKLINTLGIGESMIAGFIVGYINTKNYNSSFRLAVACGSASAFSEWLASKNDIMIMLENVK